MIYFEELSSESREERFLTSVCMQRRANKHKEREREESAKEKEMAELGDRGSIRVWVDGRGGRTKQTGLNQRPPPPVLWK